MNELHTPPLFEPALKIPERRSIISYLLIAMGGLIVILIASLMLLIAIPVKSENPGKTLRLINQMRSFILSSDRDIKGQNDDRINIALLGIGGEGHDGAYLSDTIIIGTIKPSTKQVALISIPRDLIVPIPGGFGYKKINSADSYGEIQQKGSGAEFSKQVIEQVFDIPIHYYARIDFKAFKEIIDRVGGVNIYVDRDFIDYQFPNDDYLYRTVSFKKGQQTLKGQEALDFARSRHGNNGEGSDFARARRQQKIILALKDKLLSVNTIFNLDKINDILESLNRNVSTNIEWWEISQLYKISKNLDYEKIIMRVLSAENNGPLIESMLGDASVLQARDPSFTELRRIVNNIFDDHTSITNPVTAATQINANRPNVVIQNGTWILGLAAEYKSYLENKGIKINNIGNAQVRNHQKTAVYGVDNSTTKSILEQLKIITTASPEYINSAPPENLLMPPVTSADILIILGTESDRPLNP